MLRTLGHALMEVWFRDACESGFIKMPRQPPGQRGAIPLSVRAYSSAVFQSPGPCEPTLGRARCGALVRFGENPDSPQKPCDYTTMPGALRIHIGPKFMDNTSRLQAGLRIHGKEGWVLWSEGIVMPDEKQIRCSGPKSLASTEFLWRGP